MLCQWGASSSARGLGGVPQSCLWQHGLGGLTWRRAWPTLPSPCSLRAPKGARIWDQCTATGRQADILVSPTNPGAHMEQRIPWLQWIRTGLAADLIVAVAACVQPGWVAPLVPGHLDWVLLEPPDKALHQTKLDKPPGDEKEETGATMLRCQMVQLSTFPSVPHTPPLAEYFLLTLSATPSVTTALRHQSRVL